MSTVLTTILKILRGKLKKSLLVLANNLLRNTEEPEQVITDSYPDWFKQVSLSNTVTLFSLAYCFGYSLILSSNTKLSFESLLIGNLHSIFGLSYKSYRARKVVDTIHAKKSLIDEKLRYRNNEYSVPSKTEQPGLEEKELLEGLEYKELTELLDEYRVPCWVLDIFLQGIKQNYQSLHIDSEKDLLYHSVRQQSSKLILFTYMSNPKVDRETVIQINSLGIALCLTKIWLGIVTESMDEYWYIPSHWLEQEGYSRKDFLLALVNEEVKRLNIEFAFKIIRFADSYYCNGITSIGALPWDRRLQVLYAWQQHVVYANQLEHTGQVQKSVLKHCVCMIQTVYHFIIDLFRKRCAKRRQGGDIAVNESEAALLYCTRIFPKI